MGKELTTETTAPARISDDDELIKKICMDIGKAVAHHIETMYPDAVTATSENMLLSVRNKVRNEIMAAIKVSDELNIHERLKRREKHRRDINRMRRDACSN